MRRKSRLPLEALAPFLLEVPEPPRLLNWPELFGNRNPVELEVGFGKGAFLVASGEAHPGLNFVGVEILRKYQLFTATRLAKRNLRSVRVAKADARLFLRDYIPAASVQAVHVYFPDPWWKRSHKKRRVFSDDFAGECARILQVGGRLQLATDVEEYFGVMTQSVRKIANLAPIEERQEPRPGETAAPAVTNFERKSRELGRPIFRAAFVKIDDGSSAPP